MNRRWSVDLLVQVLTAGCLALFISTLPAGANAKYAAMVVDGYTGKMIYGKNVDAPRYPASITKVMTLYIVFEELRAGRLKKTSKLNVSKFASGQAPSRLGLKPGTRISVDTAIRALVTKSANDVATVVAENIGGTQTKFARRMTKTARRIGMSKTTFRNPHGLPDRRQKTTARDLITLSMRIQSDFPEYYSYFSVKTFTYRGRTYRNYNKLLGRFKGTTGIKTGYIRASGYNLTAVVQRGNKKVVAVVLGGKTGRSRDAHMRKIITKAFPKVIAFKAPPPTRAPLPERKPSRAIAIAKAVNTPVATEVLPISGKVDTIAVASRREGVLVMRLAALAPRNREMPLAVSVSRQAPPVHNRTARAATPARNLAGNLRLAQADTSMNAMATTAYASVQNNQMISSIAALIANTTSTVGGTPETAANLRPAIRAASVPALRPATEPASGPPNRPPNRPQRRIARLILPPSSTVTPTVAVANPAPALGPALQTQARVAVLPGPEASRQPQGAPKAPPPQAVTLPEGYQIQVGAYVYKQKAEERIDEVRKAAHRLLSEAMGIAVPAENDKGTFYRARFAGLAKRDANRTCRALKKRRIPCIVLSQ
ncbi:D-alanyl-D-alanine carboxypeptidase [hydrothermal vent metagenome]|uniref:D-alanyl-D-alanine carboxypeptidase n=1 Tax=hydrothermal vent metagenome TaxID=652676 RepID=A0A3B0TT73_9ZZZZ